MLRWIGCLIVLQLLKAEECPYSCGTPNDLSFCSHVKFATCRLEESWKTQDHLAMTAFNATQTLFSTDVLANLSHPCNVVMKKIHCALQFPICEIGSDTNRLCQDACTDSIMNECPQMAGFCQNQTSDYFDRSNHCFNLQYEGPSVGMWVAGFTISLVFSVLNSIGINLQKYSLARNANATVKRTTCRQPLWVIGFTLICLGSILDFVAFGMAPQTLLAPLAALTLVWNMFIAPIFHKEKVTRQNIIATIIIFIGVTITVIYAGHSTPEYDLEDLITLYKAPVMHAYLTFILFFLLVLIISVRTIESSSVHQGGLYHIVCYGGIAGTFGGQSVLLAKSTVELVKSALWGDGSEAFSRIETYIIITGMAVCLLSQISVLNGGLKRFDALVMVPVYQSFWILTSVLGGIMYFQEYKSMTRIQTCMFPVGGGITLLGIFYLLQDRRSSTADKAHVKYSELTHAPSPSHTEIEDNSDEEAAQQRFDIDLDEEELQKDPVTNGHHDAL